MQCHLGNFKVVKGLNFSFRGLPFLSMVNYLIPPQNTRFKNKIPLQGILLMQHGKLFFLSKTYRWHIKTKQHTKKIFRKILHLEKRALRSFFGVMWMKHKKLDPSNHGNYYSFSLLGKSLDQRLRWKVL